MFDRKGIFTTSRIIFTSLFILFIVFVVRWFIGSTVLRIHDPEIISKLDDIILEINGLDQEHKVTQPPVIFREGAIAHKCTWTLDSLVKECVGLKKVMNIKTAFQCEERCCKQHGNKGCMLYQFHKKRGCFIGGKAAVNLYFTENSRKREPYCDATPIKTFSGGILKRRISRTKCEWKSEKPRGVCSGGASWQILPNKQLTSADCETTCCQDPTCITWQLIPDKGCYVGNPKSCEGAYAGDWVGKILQNHVMEQVGGR